MVKAFIPKAGKKYQVKDYLFGGLDVSGAPDGRSFSDACGADTSLLPEVSGEKSWETFYTFRPTEYPLSFCSVGNRLLAFCRKLIKAGNGYSQTDALNIIALTPEAEAFIGEHIYYRETPGDFLISDYNFPRSMVQFCIYNDGGGLCDAVGGKYDKKILIFPDKLSMDYDVNGDFSLKKLETGTVKIPDLKYVTVHAARLFGVDDNRIYASAYNDCCNWDLDVASDISADNAWASNTGADSRAGGDFTAITAFGGKVVAFKKDFTHHVYNNKNPFRVYDVARSGAICERSVCEVRGSLYYVSPEGVMKFTGSEPINISRELGIDRFEEGICGGCADSLYVMEKGKIYVYNTANSSWSRIEAPENGKLVCFAEMNGVLYALCNVSETESYIYSLTGKPRDWYVETSARTMGVFSDKRISRVSLLCDIPQGGSVRVYLSGIDGVYPKTPVIDSKGKTGRTALRSLIRRTASPLQGMKICCTGDVRLFGVQTYAYKEADGGE